MFDINAIINNAIAQAVEAHITSLKQTYANQMGAMTNHISALDSDLSTERGNLQVALQRISDLEEANKVLVHRLNEVEARLSLNHDKLVERVSEVRIRTDEARALALALAERQPTPPLDEVPEDWFKRDQLTNEFVSKLNDAEWFWNKVNHYVDTHLERRHGEEVTIDTFPELFAVEFNRKAGADNVLSRDEVAEIVRELWSEEFESEVRDVAEREIDRYDFDEKISRAVRDYDFSDEIERAIDDYDLSDKVESALDEYDLDSKIENGIDSYDFDFESKVRDVLRNARIDISI